ncbi:signal peptide peptidase-like 2A isoform X2 [Hemicordylus capensis]|uniref:signal peptide peptidase-like 2A isoform X2 n=1 Tax=Hemicordylus capensis TaxID=884348 RepID=UPI0023047A59|nr:signal peptide peptidase-like 2A isoform X2 [Hemicordylus capensis]
MGAAAAADAAAARGRLLRAALCVLLLPPMSAYEGILHAFKSSQPELTKDYCIYYYPDWVSLPKTLTNTTSMELADLTPRLFCSDSDIPSGSIKDKAVAVENGNCSLLQKAQMAQNLGAKALLVVVNGGQFSPEGNNTQYNVSIPVGIIRDLAIYDMKESFGSNINVMLYAPPSSPFDCSMVFMFLIAVLTVAVGGYWSGMAELGNLKAIASSEDSETRKKEETVALTPLMVVIFVIACCAMLLLLYFFYKWLVYVIIAIFTLASAVSMYNCLSALISKIPFGKCRLECFNKSFEVRLIFLAGICMAASIVWVVFRNEERWSWILLDILGIAFCVNFIKMLKIPNFKSCVILLLLLFLYDIFFVFITPYLTKSGESIMVEVAAGPLEMNEKLPVVFQVPHLKFYTLMFCFPSFSLLGFGDVMVPGLLVAYCHRFDVQTSSSSVYFISSTIAYAVGLVITFVALVLMKMAQPALLYLVPATLITSTIVALSRKEMKKFWNGSTYQVMDAMDYVTNEDNIITANEQHGGP